MKKFVREFFDEFKLTLRAIPPGIKKAGVAVYKGIPKLFKNFVLCIKRLGGALALQSAVTGTKAGTRMFKAWMMLRGLLIFSLIIIGFGTAVYIVSDMVVESSMATISVIGTQKWESDGKEGSVSIALSEDPDFANSTVTLKCDGIDNLTNISGSSLPLDIDSGNGSHNGEHYVAYTFYLKNTGDIPCDVREEMLIKNSIKNVDEAIRVRLYRNGEEVTYAKRSADGMAEVGTVSFMGKTVFSRSYKDLAPGSTVRYTLVIWLEGDDPECLDDLKGGAVSMSMTFSIERRDGS